MFDSGLCDSAFRTATSPLVGLESVRSRAISLCGGDGGIRGRSPLPGLQPVGGTSPGAERFAGAALSRGAARGAVPLGNPGTDCDQPLFYPTPTTGVNEPVSRRHGHGHRPNASRSLSPKRGAEREGGPRPPAWPARTASNDHPPMSKVAADRPAVSRTAKSATGGLFHAPSPLFENCASPSPGRRPTAPSTTSPPPATPASRRSVSGGPSAGRRIWPSPPPSASPPSSAGPPSARSPRRLRAAASGPPCE